MVASLQGVKKGSLVHRFITSGKPGYCELCGSFVEKLEAHHLCYSPEITIKLCHKCHHKVHFWPNRLNDVEKSKMLKLRFGHKIANQLISQEITSPVSLAKLIAPSRNAFIHAEQLKEKKALEQEAKINEKINHSPKIIKVNKEVDLSFLKRVRR